MTARLTDEQLKEAVDAYESFGSERACAAFFNCSPSTFHNRLVRAAERGLTGTKPVMPGFRIAKVSNTPRGDYIQQKPEHGEVFAVPEGHVVKGVSALVDAEGRVIQEWRKTAAGADAQRAALEATIAALKEDLPRLAPTPAPLIDYTDIANQYTVTDSHFGMLAHAEEAGADYDLKIAEQLLLDWFAAEIAQSPRGHTAILAQLGDLMHHDSLESVTPAHRHVLDADSRLHKVIRVVIRTIRRVIGMLLDTHKHVHIVMASGNHDPASSAWLREMLAVMYEQESRVSVDSSPALYYAYEWGETAIFYHHGHKRGLGDVDRVFASMFREMYGRCRFHFGHIGHRHSDKKSVPNTTLFPIEQHETLAGKDAYAAGGGFISGRSAKRISYHKRYGEVGRSTLRPEMVAGAARKPVAANDNEPQRRVA